jgi:hypothetical protein
MPPHFVLIDLVSQREAVRNLLRGVDIDARIAWMKTWGTIHTLDRHANFPQTYVFESRLGITAGFFFDDTDDFVFLGDNTTFR